MEVQVVKDIALSLLSAFGGVVFGSYLERRKEVNEQRLELLNSFVDLSTVLRLRREAIERVINGRREVHLTKFIEDEDWQPNGERYTRRRAVRTLYMEYDPVRMSQYASKGYNWLAYAGYHKVLEECLRLDWTFDLMPDRLAESNSKNLEAAKLWQSTCELVFDHEFERDGTALQFAQKYVDESKALEAKLEWMKREYEGSSFGWILRIQRLYVNWCNGW